MSTYSKVVTGLCIGLLFLCFYFAHEAYDAEQELTNAYTQMIKMGDRLNQRNQEYLELQLNTLQKMSYEGQNVIVAEGYLYVDNKPLTTNGVTAFYWARPLSGNWEGIEWELDVAYGDYIKISEEIAPGKLIATIRHYFYEENRFSEYQTVLAEK